MRVFSCFAIVSYQFVELSAGVFVQGYDLRSETKVR